MWFLFFGKIIYLLVGLNFRIIKMKKVQIWLTVCSMYFHVTHLRARYPLCQTVRPSSSTRAANVKCLVFILFVGCGQDRNPARVGYSFFFSVGGSPVSTYFHLQSLFQLLIAWFIFSTSGWHTAYFRCKGIAIYSIKQTLKELKINPLKEIKKQQSFVKIIVNFSFRSSKYAVIRK